MVFYEEVFFQWLKVSEDFLQGHAASIRDKLELAAVEFKREHGNIFAINMCLHAASSVILSNPDYLSGTLARLRDKPGLNTKDPSTVLTVIALYCLIQWDAKRAALERTNAQTRAEKEQVASYEAKLTTVRQGFDEINWIIGKEAMQILGFD